MKHIKVSAEIISAGKFKGKAKITLISQSHFREQFGKEAVPVGTDRPSRWQEKGNTVFNLGDTCMVSHIWDTFEADSPGFNRKYKWLLVPQTSKSISFVTGVEAWKWIKPLVEAYNEWGKSQ